MIYTGGNWLFCPAREESYPRKNNNGDYGFWDMGKGLVDEPRMSLSFTSWTSREQSSAKI